MLLYQIKKIQTIERGRGGEVTQTILLASSWNSEALHIKEIGDTEDGEVPKGGNSGNMAGSREPQTLWVADITEGDCGLKYRPGIGIGELEPFLLVDPTGDCSMAEAEKEEPVPLRTADPMDFEAEED